MYKDPTRVCKDFIEIYDLSKAEDTILEILMKSL